jgi:hypothetical protein
MQPTRQTQVCTSNTYVPQHYCLLGCVSCWCLTGGACDVRGSSDSRTLVHRAIAMGDLIVACELLRGGARLEARDKRRLCALDEVAARHDLHPVPQSSAIIACLATRSQF